MKMIVTISCVALLAMSGAFAQSEVVALTPDDVNTTEPRFEAQTAADVLNDPFAYDPADPTSVLPANVWGDPNTFYHGPDDAAATIAFDVTDGVYANLFVDLYGRAGCCFDRDDNLNIEFYLGGELQETVSVSVDDTTLHGRATASPDTQADAIWIVDTGSVFSTTLAEIRVNGEAVVVAAAPVITPSAAFAIDGKFFSLTAPDGAVAGYVWVKVGGATLGTTTATHAFDPITAADAGTYSVTYDDGATKTVITLTIDVDVLPAGNEVPLTGLLGLGILAGACVLGGRSVLRGKK